MFDIYRPAYFFAPFQERLKKIGGERAKATLICTNGLITEPVNIASQPQKDNLICELSPRMSAEIEKLVTSMNTSYDDLSGIQADTLSMDASDVCVRPKHLYIHT